MKYPNESTNELPALHMPRGLDATCAAIRREGPGLALLVDGDGYAVDVIDHERGADLADVDSRGFVS